MNKPSLRATCKTQLPQASAVQRRGWTLGAIAFAASHAWAQTTTTPEAPTQGAQQVDPQAAQQVDPQVNAQVLQSWQQQTGQAASMNAQGKLEFHGEAALDVYSNSKSSPSGNPALSPLRDGTFEKAVLQGDVRSISGEQDTTYAQGVLTATNDRGVLQRYANIVNSLQVGRTGVGYQMAFGDVVAGFSGLSSSLGLRGALGAREFGAFTLTGFAGTVAESWEALAQRSALDGLPPRSRYLRDVMGLKGDYKISSELSAFATLQNYHDRASSAPLPIGSPALEGTSVSVGSKYASGPLQASAELARSTRHDQIANTDQTDSAFVVDGTYRFTALGLRAGYHNLGTGFASLAQSVAPGIREWYAGADWTITPQLTWSLDVRDATTRIAATGLNPASQTSLETLTNRLNYSVQDIPGLVFSLSDTRNKGKDTLGNPTVNDSTQLTGAYGNVAWSANALLGVGRARSPANPAADSDSSNWQLSLSRNWSNASAEKQASWTLGLQGTAGAQVQKLIATGNATRSNTLGLNLTGTSQPYGNIGLGWQRQHTTQPTLGAPALTTNSLNLDWTKPFGPQWTVKGYAKVNRRNHGDVLLQVDERVVGLQGAYKW